MDDAVNIGLHYIQQHLDFPETYARVLYVDFSLVYNTVIPEILWTKLTQLTGPASTSHWTISFLTDWQEAAGDAGKNPIQYMDGQHKRPTGMCTPPTAFLVFSTLMTAPPATHLSHAETKFVSEKAEGTAEKHQENLTPRGGTGSEDSLWPISVFMSPLGFASAHLES